MSQRTLLLPLPKPLRRIPIQQPTIVLLSLKHLIINLMFWQQIHSPRTTSQEILLSGFAKCDVVGRAGVRAKDYHVDEITAVSGNGLLRGAGRFAVYAAGRKDGFDGVYYYAGCWEEKVTSVVLGHLSVFGLRLGGAGIWEKGEIYDSNDSARFQD